jgi:hypothetical protein
MTMLRYHVKKRTRDFSTANLLKPAPRPILQLGGGVAGGMIPRPADATPALARITYPSTRLANVKDLKVDVAVQIQYPDKDSPGVIIKPGRKVEGALGLTATSSPSRRFAERITLGEGVALMRCLLRTRLPSTRPRALRV